MMGRAPHLVGETFLKHFGIRPGSIDAHAFTYLDFAQAARTYGKVGGFAHLATLVKQMKASRPGALLLDGGDTWQGSGTALWSKAQDMVDACKLLGVDIMTLHWESTYGAERVKEIEARTSGPHRHRGAERQDHGLRGPGLQALRDPQDQRCAGGDHRPGLPHTDRQPALLHARMELRHPGRADAGDGGRGPRQGRTGHRGVVAQRHGCGHQDGLAGDRHRRDLRRPHTTTACRRRPSSRTRAARPW